MRTYKGRNRASDWTPEEDKALQALRVKPWTVRYLAGPSCFSEIAAKYGRTVPACRDRYYKLRRQAGINGSTAEGLWSPEEDQLIRDEIPLKGRVWPGTWVELSEVLNCRTVSAIRNRACSLRRREKLSV